MIDLLAPSEVLRRGLILLGVSDEKQNHMEQKVLVRLFNAIYGVKPVVAGILWSDLQTTDIAAARIYQSELKKFDWYLSALQFLAGYDIEEDRAIRFDCHEQTVRQWGWRFIKKIGALRENKVKWPDDNWGSTVFVTSHDCVNFGINEPCHPTLHKDKKMFDRKGGKAGWTYEIALDLWESRIVWASGPHPPNSGGDAAIYQMPGGLMEKLPPGKKTIADKIYKGLDKVALHNSADEDAVREFKGRARARQESINARLKKFAVLKHRFRHKKDKHKLVFDACLVLVAISLENGSPLFPV